LADPRPPLADDTFGPFALFEQDAPISIAIYNDLAARDELMDRLEALASPMPTKRVHTGEEALACAGEEAMILVDPDDPPAAVAFFDRGRDLFLERPARCVLLLLRGGSGEAALSDAPSLASFARIASFEVGASPTFADLERAFEERHGKTYQAWLGEWRDGALADTLENNHILSEALSLEGGP